MKFGRLEDGTRISADVATKGDTKYMCPCCGARLVLKQGPLRDWHFAHESDAECDAFTESKMSEWHIKHQEQFPEQCREVRLELDGVVHIADIMIDGLIIEFQHSPMSNETFEERSRFYSKFGRLLWVFDCRKQWTESNIVWIEKKVGSERGYFEWRYPSKMLGQYDFKKSRVDLFLELDLTGWGCLVDWNPTYMKYFNGARYDQKQLSMHYGQMKRPFLPYHADPVDALFDRLDGADVLVENARIKQDREEEERRREAARKYAEEEAKREQRRQEAQKEADYLLPIVRKLQADEEWATRTLSDVRSELEEKKRKLDQCYRVLEGTA